MMIYKWLQESQLDPNINVDLIEGNRDEILNNIDNEEIDAIVSWDPWLELILQKYDFRIVKERLFWSVIFISQRYIEESPQGAIKYLAALNEALFWAAENKELVSKWVSERSGLEIDFNSQI